MANGFLPSLREVKGPPHVFLPVHPAPILQASYPDSRQFNKALAELIESSSPIVNEGNPGLKIFFDGESVLLRSCFSEFRAWVEGLAKVFATEALGLDASSGFTVTDSWVNETRDGGFQQPHIHTNSFISGTYYIKRSAGHSPIVFANPRRNAVPTTPSLSLRTVSHTPFNSDAVIAPDEGDILLWESHQLHGYPPSAPGRQSLSMNLMPLTTSNGVYGFHATPVQP
jgi:uncharacterized protein (TIGR02466 family)